MTGRIAITGASSFLGERLLRRLIRDGHGDDLVVIDVAEPSISEGVIHFRKVDLTEPAADQAILDLLKADGIETLVHLAFFTNPRRDTTNAHELESIGTLAVLAAAAAARVKNFVMRSFTLVYGARAQNPALIREDTPLPSRAPLGWLRDKVEAEEHAASFARRYPEMLVRVLRFAPLLGPQVRTFYSRIFDRRLVPTLLGYDPLLQLLHPDDAEEALVRGTFSSTRGAFNITPRGVLPLSNGIHLSGKVPAPPRFRTLSPTGRPMLFMRPASSKPRRVSSTTSGIRALRMVRRRSANSISLRSSPPARRSTATSSIGIRFLKSR